MAAPVRWIHAADFHLEQPAGGLVDVPDRLRESLLEAPYRAAEKVFDTALSAKVDFVLLAGDILQPRAAGPRALVFLVEQFRRLAEAQIRVYWAGGTTDPPGAWPEGLALPDNCTVFPANSAREVIHFRDDRPVAAVIGLSRRGRRRVRPEDFRAQGTDVPVVAVAHGPTNPAALEGAAVDYWALGGRHRRTTLFSGERSAQYCGTQQGRNPDETGPHGCLQVEHDESGCHATFVPTDTIRYFAERAVLDDDAANASTLAETLVDRFLETHASSARNVAANLVRWTIAGHSPLVSRLTRFDEREQLVGDIRKQLAERSPNVWATSLEIEPVASGEPAESDDQTMLGDFLRELSRRGEDTADIDFTEFIEHDALREVLTDAVVLDHEDEQTRRRLWHEVAALGRELLTAEGDAR
mgnify:FL=1